MSNVTKIMDNSLQGLMAHRDAINTSSNNIANVNTPNYSRQRAEYSSRDPVSFRGTKTSGGGVEIAKVRRMHDEFIQKQILDQAEVFGNAKVQNEQLRRIERLVHSGSTSVSNRISDFFNKVRELSANPEISTHRFAVKEAAKAMAVSFNNVADSLQGIRLDLDFRLQKAVDDVNLMTKDLAHLNRLVASFAGSRQPPNELLDKQDSIVEALSQKLGYQIEKDQHGQITVIVPGAGVLVHGHDAAELSLIREADQPGVEGATAKILIKDISGREMPAQTLRAGEVGGLFHVKDQVIAPAIKQLDFIAHTMAERVNQIHEKGTGLDGSEEIEIFTGLNGVDGAAGLIRISQDVDFSADKIATGFSATHAGDNRLALDLVALQDEQLMPPLVKTGVGEEPRFTFNESINTLVTNVATETRTQEMTYEHQNAIREQLLNQKKSFSGVSLEEEAMQLMQYQAAFNAAAKTMRVGDELLTTVIGLVD